MFLFYSWIFPASLFTPKANYLSNYNTIYGGGGGVSRHLYFTNFQERRLRVIEFLKIDYYKWVVSYSRERVSRSSEAAASHSI